MAAEGPGASRESRAQLRQMFLIGTIASVLGIALGLLIGKPIGVFGAIRLAVATGLGRLPANVTWNQMLGLAALCGIGFTMSLFIGGLAFTDTSHAAQVRLGVLSGSIISALIGYALLARSEPKPNLAAPISD